MENETMIVNVDKYSQEKDAKSTTPPLPFPQHFQKQKVDSQF